MRKVHRCTFASLLAVFLIVLATDIAEARRFRIGSGVRILNGAIKNYGPDTLSASQLKDCLIFERSLERTDAGLKARHEKISLAQRANSLSKAAIEVARSQVDQFSQNSVDNFNVQVTEYNAAAQATSKAAAAYNVEVERGKANVSRFNRECGGKSYFEDDLLAARAELGVTGD